MSIYQNLPHDIIIRIIKEADGGLSNHKKNMKETLSILERGRISADEYIRKWGQLDASYDADNTKYVICDEASGRSFETNDWMFRFLEFLYDFQGDLDEAFCWSFPPTYDN